MTTESASTKSGPRWGLAIWLVISQLLALASLFLWLVFAAFAVMAFDSGISTEAAIFVGLVWAYPIFPLACAIAAWILFVKKKNLAALVVTTLPVLPPLLYMVWLQLPL